jgi:hypothetical protein
MAQPNAEQPHSAFSEADQKQLDADKVMRMYF